MTSGREVVLVFYCELDPNMSGVAKMPTRDLGEEAMRAIELVSGAHMFTNASIEADRTGALAALYHVLCGSEYELDMGAVRRALPHAGWKKYPLSYAGNVLEPCETVTACFNLIG